MRKRDAFLQYVPYMYLARPEGQDCYHLFVAIRKQVDEEVNPEGVGISYRDGVTAIALRVSPKAGASGGSASDFFLMHYELWPEANTHQPFNPEAFDVEVKVQVMKRAWKLEAKAYANRMSYSDADNQPAPEGQPGSEPAFNCPYIYLEQEALPAKTGEGGGYAFFPYVLLAPKGYRLSGQKVSSPEDGVLEYLLVLSKEEGTRAGGSFHPFITPSELTANTLEYPEKGLPEGNFAVTVTFLENEAEVLHPKGPRARRRSTVDLERAGSNGRSSGQLLAARQDEANKAARRAKTRNMSSRRNQV